MSSAGSFGPDPAQAGTGDHPRGHGGQGPHRRLVHRGGGLLVVVALFALNFYTLPVVALIPGPVEDVLPKVKVIGGQRTYDSKGQLNLTTVSEDVDVRFYEGLLDLADRNVAVVPRSLLFAPGESREQADIQDSAEMDQSKRAAIVVALRALGYKVDTRPVATEVLAVLHGGPSDGHLQRGDRIVTVDGSAVRSTTEARAAIVRRRPGDSVRFEVQRGGTRREAVVKTRQDPADKSRAIVGITLSDIFDLPVQIQIDTKNIGGPSAGLIFALSVVDRLTPEDLTGGRDIAGTGTVDFDGKVGPIGGVQQKVVAAARAGATLFFVPKGDYAEAKRIDAAGMRLVPVGTVTEALTYLRSKVAAG